MTKVHHLESSRSIRLLWLLEELGVDYELVTYERNPKTMRAPDTLKALHPLGRFPLLEIDGKVIVESGAIISYMVEREAKLGPADNEAAKLDYNYWLHYAEASAMPPVLVKLITAGVKSAPLPFFIKPIAKFQSSIIDYKEEKIKTSLNHNLVGQNLVYRLPLSNQLKLTRVRFHHLWRFRESACRHPRIPRSVRWRTFGPS